MTSRKKTDTLNDWLSNPYAKISGIIAFVVLGYNIGVYKKDLDCNKEQIQIKQEYNEKLFIQMKDCQNDKLNKIESSVHDLKKVVENIKENEIK